MAKNDKKWPKMTKNDQKQGQKGPKIDFFKNRPNSPKHLFINFFEPEIENFVKIEVPLTPTDF